MTGYIVSLLMGLIVGVVYALVQVRSPAPPLIALVGLLGMVLGEQAVGMAKRHFRLPPQTSMGQPAGSVHSCGTTPPGTRKLGWARGWTAALPAAQKPDFPLRG